MTEPLPVQPGNDATLRHFPRFSEEIQTALKKWNTAKAAVPLRHWHIFRNAFAESGAVPRSIVNRRLLAQIEALQKEDPRNAEILRLRFLQDLKVDQVANRLNLDNSRIHSLQAEGIDTIVESLWQEEACALTAHRQKVAAHFDLPPTAHLIGIHASSDELYELLKTPAPPWIVCLEGIGGIGKTSLASDVFSNLIDYSDYQGFAWVSAKQSSFNLGGGITARSEAAFSSEGLVDALLQQLEEETNGLHLLSLAQKQAMLQQRLKAAPHFVVIDNLETVADIDALLPLLERWSNPTRFLLTSRIRYESDSGIHHYTVPELSEADAVCLVRHQAALRQTYALVQASDDELQAIYGVVGGNPLALRLVVGWSHAQGLALVLEDLRLARGQRVEDLYTYIYRKAWESLEEAAQLAWLTMPLIHEKSVTLNEILRTMEDLDKRPDAHQTRYALDRLVQLNLVDAQSDLQEPRYSIHPLTRTFLQEQIGKWLA